MKFKKVFPNDDFIGIITAHVYIFIFIYNWSQYIFYFRKIELKNLAENNGIITIIYDTCIHKGIPYEGV